jgi:hypothetical protein
MIRKRNLKGLRNLHAFFGTRDAPRTELDPICRDPEPTGWKSIAWWPETVSLMSEENTSTDTHHSEEAARAVCGMLRRNGLGGDGKIFPLKTDVEPIFPENS